MSCLGCIVWSPQLTVAVRCMQMMGQLINIVGVCVCVCMCFMSTCQHMQPSTSTVCIHSTMLLLNCTALQARCVTSVRAYAPPTNVCLNTLLTAVSVVLLCCCRSSMTVAAATGRHNQSTQMLESCQAQAAPGILVMRDSALPVWGTGGDCHALGETPLLGVKPLFWSNLKLGATTPTGGRCAYALC